MTLHMVKLCVGVTKIAEMFEWQERAAMAGPDGLSVVRHVTRSHPRRADELLSGGSLYWVVKGRIICRNPIVGFEILEGEAARHQRGRNPHPRQCAIILRAGPIPTLPKAHRPFQGWRYLEDAAAPGDMETNMTVGSHDKLATELQDLGLI